MPRSTVPARGRIRATFAHYRGSQYERPGGPWDRDALDASFARVPPGAVVDDNGRVEGPDLEDHIAALSGGLRASGVDRGDVVCWQLPNCASALLLYRACWRIGAIAAPLHHRLGRFEVTAAVEEVAPKLVVASEGSPASALRAARAVPGIPLPEALEDLLVSRRRVAPGGSGVEASDIAVALFTSGSTGAPKAVLHTHRGLAYKAYSMVEVHGLGPADVVLMPAPLAHVSGLLNGVLIPAAAGIPSVLMASWDPDAGLERIETQRVSFMGAPPVFFSQMAAASSFEPGRVASLRLISTGGASVSPAFVEATARAFGCRVKRTYGSTEAPTVTTSGPDDDPDKARDTDGRAVGELEVEIHSPGDGRKLGAREPGEIWLRGPELFAGYADEAASEEVIARPGGWYRSGDLGVLDEGGWLRVVGRISDIVIRAGENISASEVEAILEAHPAVRHAVAVGVPDPDLGEKLAAFVESDEPFDLESCRSWFSERGVARFKTPEIVVRLRQLPHLAAGKVDRRAIRKMAEETTGA